MSFRKFNIRFWSWNEKCITTGLGVSIFIYFARDPFSLEIISEATDNLISQFCTIKSEVGH